MRNHLKYLNKRLSSLRWTLDRSLDPIEQAEINSEIRRIKSDIATIERDMTRSTPLRMQPA